MREDARRSRAALRASAAELFARDGIEVPLDAIARHAGVSNATLYRHFPERSTLVAEILVANLERAHAALVESLDLDSGWEGLERYLGWLFAEQIDNAAYMGALRAIPAGLDARVDEMRDRTLAELEELIARSKAEGRLRADRWIEDVFLFLALNEHLAHGHADPHSASRRLLELFLASVRVEEPRPMSAEEPDTVLALRRTLGSELAGLPAADPRSGPPT